MSKKKKKFPKDYIKQKKEMAELNSWYERRVQNSIGLLEDTKTRYESMLKALRFEKELYQQQAALYKKDRSLFSKLFRTARIAPGVYEFGDIDSALNYLRRNLKDRKVEKIIISTKI